MIHKHPVYDTDEHFVIDPDTRVITNTSKNKTSIVQGDHNSERFSFEIPKLVDGHDMTLCNLIQIHFINIGSGRDEAEGVYEADDIAVMDENPETVVFTWLVSDAATYYDGTLAFAVTFECIESGVVTYRWGTAIHSGFAIQKGMNNAESVTDGYPDILAQWYSKIFQTNFGYEAAKKYGFEGTEQEWLETLRGPKGDIEVYVGDSEPNGAPYFWFDTAQDLEGVKELIGAFRSADKNGNKQVLYPITKIDLVNGLRAYLESLEVSRTITGSLLAVNGSANLPLIGFSLYGKSEQFTTIGTQLWNHQKENEQTLNGVTCAYDNGVYTLNGTSDMSFNFIVGRISLEDGAYTLSANNPSHNSNSGQPLIQIYSATTGNSLYCIGNKANTVATQEMLASTDYDLRIRIEEGVTYDDFVIKPMLNKGSSVLPWELYTGGRPSPNPDYPQEIVNIGDAGSVDVSVCGKNLLPNDATTTTRNGVTFTVNADGSITANGTAEGTASIEIYSGTFQDDCVLTGCPTGGGDNNYRLQIVNYTNGIYTIIARDVGNGSELDISMFNTGYVEIIIPNGVTANNLIFKPMIRKKLIDDDIYEPYTAKQVLTLSTPGGFPGIPVNSGGNYIDSNGQQWICDEIRFNSDGTSEYIWRIKCTTVPLTYSANDNRYTGKLTTPALNSYCICTTSIYNPDSGQIGNAVNGCHIGGDSYDTLIIRENGELTEAKIAYAMKKPSIQTLYDEEIDAYKALHTNKPYTTVINDENADMSMTYYSERYDDFVNFILDKFDKTNADIRAIKGVTEVTLLASGWTGSTAPYSQTVSVSGITEDDNPTLVTAMYDNISLETKAAYLKAFGIISAGEGTTENGSVIFSVSEKPTIDIVIGLKGA